MSEDSYGSHYAISTGIRDGLAEMGAELHGCTPSMLVFYVQRAIAKDRVLND